MRVLITLILTLLTTIALTQPKSKYAKKALKLVQAGEYNDAIDYYLKIDSLSKKKINPEIQYQIGYCYFHTNAEKEKSETYFKEYLNNSDSIHQAYYYLARIQHLQYKFDDAISNYKKFLNKTISNPYLTAELKDELILSVKREIEHCKYGKVAIKNPRNVVIDNLGDSINTEYPEYATVISDNEKHLIFTSKRPDSNGKKKTEDGQYYEDIYHANLLKGSLFDEHIFENSNGVNSFSLLTNFEYSKAKKINGQINSETHDGSIQLARDNRTLFFYRNNDVWKADIMDSTAAPRHVGSYVNSEHFEPSIFFSYNGKRLFVVSDRAGGFGGLDIYMAYLQPGGTWSKLQNLGKNVNTEYDEDAPYLDPNDSTFYFASKGHTSMGAYDIFKTTLRDTGAERTSDAINLGAPINTPADDIYFIMTPKYNRAYYASEHLDGKGSMDLYRITFADERNPLAELAGYVWEGDKKKPIESKITLTSLDSSYNMSQTSDKTTGKYLMLLGHGKTYKMQVETPGFIPYEKIIHIPEQKEYFQLYQEIHHVYLKDKFGKVIGQKITVFNSFNNTDKTISDTLTTLYDKMTLEHIKELQDKGELVNASINTDVKFYMSEDSLGNLMGKDTSLAFDYSSNTDVSYLNKETNEYEKGEHDNDKNVVLNDPKSLNKLRLGTLNRDIVLYFEYNDHSIQEDYKKELKAFLDYMNRYPDKSFEIVGHTDAIGSDKYNMKLSFERSLEVYMYLVDNGIKSERIKISAKGENEPAAKNYTTDGKEYEKGMRLNRRVQFKEI